MTKLKSYFVNCVCNRRKKDRIHEEQPRYRRIYHLKSIDLNITASTLKILITLKTTVLSHIIIYWGNSINTNRKYVFTDINECTVFHNLCVFGKCENTFGMFRCECNDGYKLDGSGGNCTDIDECESPQSCIYGDCANVQGSYRCVCPPNYELVAEGNACIGKNNEYCRHESEFKKLYSYIIFLNSLYISLDLEKATFETSWRNVGR